VEKVSSLKLKLSVLFLPKLKNTVVKNNLD
jgi:hypothetical protein